jgi:diguanylate cyclase (GGDEF)-like protein
LTDARLAARENAVLAREQAVARREQAAEQREAAVEATNEFRVQTEAQLREANEQLVIATVQAHTSTEAAEHTAAQMTLKAERDFLTGLPNRALLTDRLGQSIALADRHGKKVALMFLDLDHFKQVNDSLGHRVGDRLLQSVAQRLATTLRKSDTISRQGGDEFVVLLTEVAAVEDAALTAEKLIKAMAEPHLIDDHQLNITLSIGISVYPEDGADVDAVLTNADAAMYHAKRAGRNTYRRFTSDMRVNPAAV